MSDDALDFLTAEIDHIFAERESVLERRRRTRDEAEARRLERARAFRELVEGTIRPVMLEVGRRVKRHGLSFQVLDQGLFDARRKTFEARQAVRFVLEFPAEGPQAVGVRGDAFVAFATGSDVETVTLTRRVVGRDEVKLSPYRWSSSAAIELAADEVDAQRVAAELVALVSEAVRSTYLEPRADEEEPDREAAAQGI